jgi:membrane fusion protein (multidrug efflux system)
VSDNSETASGQSGGGHTVVNSGGTQIVPSGGHAGSTTVNSGGTQIISGGGQAEQTPEKPQEKAGGDQKKQDEGKGKGNGRGRKILVRVIFLLALVVVAIGAFVYWWSGRDFVDTDDAYTDGRAVTIAPRVSGQVIALDVNDNQPLKKGQVIIQLDPRDYQAAVDKAAGTLLQDQGQLDQARIDLEKAAITYPAQLLQAQGNLEEAQATNRPKVRSRWRRRSCRSPSWCSRTSPMPRPA